MSGSGRARVGSTLRPTPPSEVLVSDIPEADAQEQHRGANGDDDEESPDIDAEASEADAIDQAEDLRHSGHPTGERSQEVPEADAYEQSLDVGGDEEDEARD
jgi:hypothetical protein